MITSVTQKSHALINAIQWNLLTEDIWQAECLKVKLCEGVEKEYRFFGIVLLYLDVRKISFRLYQQQYHLRGFLKTVRPTPRFP